MFHMRRNNLDGYRNALDYLNQAVAFDPNFALAFASMPAVYSNLATSSGLDPGEALSKGKAAAQRALELDGALAEAHNGLAVIRRQEWDWAGAEESFKRAIELNPNLAAAHGNYALHLAITGRTAEALSENRRAQELDPFRITYKGAEGGILVSARKYDEALLVFRDVVRMQPDYALAHVGLGHTYAAKGMYAEAVNEFRTAGSLYGGVTNALSDQGYAYAMWGKRGEALAILNRLKASREYVSPAGLAVLHAALGDKEAAFRWLERAYAEHDSQLQHLKVDPRCDSLRSDPRFADLLRRMRLAS
jgi:tetratricopeptide (TPR) repeat protein